jgi:osmotically-inducible protein OsmY
MAGMNKIKVVTVFAALAGSSAMALAASDVKVYGGPSDSQITSAVRGKIGEFPDLLAPNEVRVQTRNRVVYLYGHVNTVVERDQAEATAAGVEGVRKVIDAISLDEAGG